MTAEAEHWVVGNLTPVPATGLLGELHLLYSPSVLHWAPPGGLWLLPHLSGVTAKLTPGLRKLSLWLAVTLPWSPRTFQTTF